MAKKKDNCGSCIYYDKEDERTIDDKAFSYCQFTAPASFSRFLMPGWREVKALEFLNCRCYVRRRK